MCELKIDDRRVLLGVTRCFCFCFDDNAGNFWWEVGTHISNISVKGLQAKFFYSSLALSQIIPPLTSHVQVDRAPPVLHGLCYRKSGLTLCSPSTSFSWGNRLDKHCLNIFHPAAFYKLLDNVLITMLLESQF